KDPEDRYPSAAVLRDTLERIRARTTMTAQIAAPTSAGPAMRATIMPVAEPSGPPIVSASTMPLRPSIPPPSRPRTRYTPPPPQSGLSPEMRNFAVFCAVVLVALAAFAVGETFHYMSLRPAEPPKK